MIKFGNFITLLFFLNFTTLPSVFALLSWDLPTANVVIGDEEINNLNLEIDVKPSPNAFNIKYLSKISTFSDDEKICFIKDDFNRLSIYLNIFSPPPNYSI